MATVAFSHFYKIPLVPKVTKFIFYNISSCLLTLSSQNFFWWDKSMFALRKKYFFNGKPKMTKKNWIWKIENLPKWPNIRIWDFQLFKFKFFCHFWFSIKKNFVYQKQIYFCLTKTILRVIASIKTKIYYKR